MTIHQALSEGRSILNTSGTDTASLDAALLLAHTMNIRREELYMRLSEELRAVHYEKYLMLLERRRQGEPAAWILGRKEFWGRNFTVGPGVLTPRPDSEILIEKALEFMDSPNCPSSDNSGKNSFPLRLFDCCTGPGTLALTLAAERPEWHVSAGDICPKAEEFFQINNTNLTGGKVHFRRGNLMEQESGPFSLVVSNPPYLTPEETAERRRQGWKEPSLALNGGGADGLDIIRRLIPQVFSRLLPGGALFIEASPPQMPIIRNIFLENGFENPGIYEDLGRRERVICSIKPPEESTL
nr:MAG: protein-(glutamine-N5) methyltransferase, release factor-specific [Spirochaetales bacterium]